MASGDAHSRQGLGEALQMDSHRPDGLRLLSEPWDIPPGLCKPHHVNKQHVEIAI